MTQIERQQEKELAYRASGVAVSLRWKRNTGGVMASSTTTRTPPTETENGSTMATHDKRSTGADRNADIVLGAAVIAMGLLAGLYFFSAIAVMPALTAADDRTLVDAMQQMIARSRTRPSSWSSSVPGCSPRSPSFRRVAPARPRPQAGSSPASPSTR